MSLLSGGSCLPPATCVRHETEIGCLGSLVDGFGMRRGAPPRAVPFAFRNRRAEASPAPSPSPPLSRRVSAFSRGGVACLASFNEGPLRNERQARFRISAGPAPGCRFPAAKPTRVHLTPGAGTSTTCSTVHGALLIPHLDPKGTLCSCSICSLKRAILLGGCWKVPP